MDKQIHIRTIHMSECRCTGRVLATQTYLKHLRVKQFICNIKQLYVIHNDLLKKGVPLRLVTQLAKLRQDDSRSRPVLVGKRLCRHAGVVHTTCTVTSEEPSQHHLWLVHVCNFEEFPACMLHKQNLPKKNTYSIIYINSTLYSFT